MKRLVWIASYPKSGNTWVRLLLANYLRRASANHPIEINRIGFGSIAALRATIDEWSALEASDLVPHEVAATRSAVYRAMAAAASERIYLKVHDAWTLDHCGTPIFPIDVTACVVYVVRHPFDVVVSLAHHLDTSINRSAALLSDPAFTLASSRVAIGHQIPQHVGTWSGHVHSWLDHSGLPIVLVRFEDLKRDAVGTFVGMLRALGEEVVQDQIAQAVGHASFEQLQQQERDRGFSERQSQTALFFRGGRTGDGRRELARETIERIVEVHGPTMTRLGYLETGETV